MFEVVKVVDGDTLHILRGEKTVKLRLLSVDTEERIYEGGGGSPSKPQTVYGEESGLWAVDFFAQRAGPDGKTRVGLRFPRDVEAYDIYGRLLCHVILDDGTDFNLLLVREGRSPYFNKYGNSVICHADFMRAQAQARARRLGVWNPATNRAKDPQMPQARRPYERLIPWWQARSEAVEVFRQRSAAGEAVVAADDPEGLEAACERGQEVEVFAAINRFFDEDDGSRTVLLRSGDKRRSLRVIISPAARAAHERLQLDARLEEYLQNYLWVKGTLKRGGTRLRAGLQTPPDNGAWPIRPTTIATRKRSVPRDSKRC